MRPKNVADWAEVIITEDFWLETMEKCGFEKAYVTTISSPKSAIKAMD